MSAAMKDNHLTSLEMFESTFSGTRYVSTMSREHFDFLLNCLRFGNKNIRNERRIEDTFAPIRGIWEEFLTCCRNNYKPGSYVTIDEQLPAFRSCCPFCMYLPSKPDKYGIKIVLLCDVKTKYMFDGCPYVGKHTIKNLRRSIHGSNRNVTVNNWFLKVPLAIEMARLPINLTMVGTLWAGNST